MKFPKLVSSAVVLLILVVSSMLKKTLWPAAEMTNSPSEACFKRRVQSDSKLQACVSVSIYLTQL